MASASAGQTPAFVALTDDLPGEVEAKAPMLVGRRVRIEATRHSDLLHGIQDTGGEAQLPSHLSPEDVQLWQTACVVRHAPSSGELVTIITVSHAAG